MTGRVSTQATDVTHEASGTPEAGGTHETDGIRGTDGTHEANGTRETNDPNLTRETNGTSGMTRREALRLLGGAAVATLGSGCLGADSAQSATGLHYRNLTDVARLLESGEISSVGSHEPCSTGSNEPTQR